MEEAGADLIELGIPFSDSSENFYTNGFHDLCKCGILLWYRALCEDGSRNRDGVIGGSAIVKLCEKYGADCVPHISTFVKEMKDAIRQKGHAKKMARYVKDLVQAVVQGREGI